MGKVMRWGFPTHRVWLVIVSFCLVVGTAWAHVRLDGIVEIASTDSLPPFRLASRQALDNQGKPLDTYAVTPSDILEFHPSAPSGKHVSLLVGTCPTQCAPCKISQGRALAAERGRLRVGVGALSVVGGLDIAVVGSAMESKVLCGGNPPTHFFPDRGTKTWKEVREKLKGNAYELALVPRAQRRVFPGDLVKATIAYQYSAGQFAGSEPFTVVETTARVNRTGRVYLPGLSSPGPAELSSTVHINDFLRQNAVPASFDVAVWRPGLTYNEQATLDEIERCLVIVRESVAESPFPKQAERCQELGIEKNIYGGNPDNNKFLVYRLEAEQTYNVVIGEISDDIRLERQFRPGETVTSGVRDVLRKFRGVELSFRRTHYITVVPRKELGVDADKPFFALVEDGKSIILDRVLIAPGDSLILTNSRPSTP